MHTHPSHASRNQHPLPLMCYPSPFATPRSGCSKPDPSAITAALKANGFDPFTPLYITAPRSEADSKESEAALSTIRGKGYKVIQSTSLASPKAPSSAEADDLIDFELALRADKFMGHSRDAFSALAALQRRAARAWAGHYDGGEAPLVRSLPLLAAP